MLYYKVEFVVGIKDFHPDSSGDEIFSLSQMGEKMVASDPRFGVVSSVNLGEFALIDKKTARKYRDGGFLSHFTEEGGI